MAITRLSGGTTPANGSDPRTFPAIWNDAVDDIEAAESAIGVIEANDWVTSARIEDGAVTAPKLATTAGAVMVFDDSAARGSAIPSPSEGMVTYLKDTDTVEVYDGSAFGAFGGKILQVVSTTKTDAFTASLAAGAETEIPDLTATITPSSTASKIWVVISVVVGRSGSADVHTLTLYRGATAISIGDSAGSRVQRTSGASNFPRAGIGSGIINFLDSPSTTSATTYSVQVGHTDTVTDTVFVNRSELDTDGVAFSRATSTITLMEVAG